MTPSALADDLLAEDVNADPYPYFAALREHDPVHYSERHRAWLVTRYDDVVAGMKDLRLSSDRVRPLLEAMPAEKRASAGPVMEMITGWMVVTDPPVHTRLRRLAANAFQPQRVARMEDQIRAIVDQILDDFIARGETDLVAGFAYPLPATVIAEIMGAPPEDRDRFKDWSDALAAVAFGAGGEARDDRHARALRGLEELFAYLEGLIERARREPGEDMISALLEGDGTGERLTDEETKAMCALMLFAGHETTTSTITSAVLTLLRHPDQRALLEGDPALAKSTVEEALRVEGAIKVLHRWVIEDLEIRGRRIEKGQRVLLVPAAANRDPEKFPDPDRVDITRSPNLHVAFGRGIHACIGAQLARMEMRVALERVFARLPGLRLAEPEGELDWLPSLASRTLRSLPVAHDQG
jgi:cytochrome P450